MRISDWSSDVCSSDLERRQVRFDDDLDGFSAFGTPSRPTYAAALADADKPARTDLHDRIALLLRRGKRHLDGTRSGDVHQRHIDRFDLHATFSVADLRCSACSRSITKSRVMTRTPSSIVSGVIRSGVTP